MHNSLDSTFCKKCGTAVSQIEIDEARAKLDALIVEGNHAFNEGRTGEALAVAESVIESDPNSISALWLKAICHERRGEVALALECAETIVDINPDSELDRIRRNQLREKLAASVLVYEQPDRRVATIGAIAAVVLVLCIGALSATLLRNRPETETVAYNGPGETFKSQVQAPTNPISTPQASVVKPPQGADEGVTTAPQMGDEPPIGRRQQQQPIERQPVLPDPPAGTVIPMPDGTIGPVTFDRIPPSDPPVVKPQVDPPTKPPTNPPTRGDDPPETFQVASQESPGTIDIKVYNDNGKPTTRPSSAGAQPSANGLQMLTKTAYQAYQLGNFSQAANLFQQALRSGGNPVVLNQRLGQSYERMGQINEAVDAYRRAVQAGEAAIAQGKPDPNGTKASMDSSKQALKKLGG